ncbi:MAG: phytoene/squalene synthase family protein [Actinomycetota bacterium]|nr:MAG: phytoene/squalene synthase family protein [Actinomycetota bacterium]
MSTRALDAAGIVEPRLRASYEQCRRLHLAHGKTYYLATLLLPPAKRPYVHALYGFARYADEIVDELHPATGVAERAARLARLRDAFFADLDRGWSDHVVRRAVVDTVVRWELPRSHFEAFLESMAMDLTVTSYDTYADLLRYTYGSAAVIGLQLVPILGPTRPEAYEYAMDLGLAFQLANFIRDVGEDLDRGRVYLPLDELAAHGVDRAMLQRRQVTPQLRAALRDQVARVRALAERARPGAAMLHPSSRPCVDAARILYCGIVDAVEAADYQVFDRRAAVPMSRRLGVALPAWLHAVLARRRFGTGPQPAVSAAGR